MMETYREIYALRKRIEEAGAWHFITNIKYPEDVMITEYNGIFFLCSDYFQHTDTIVDNCLMTDRVPDGSDLVNLNDVLGIRRSFDLYKDHPSYMAGYINDMSAYCASHYIKDIFKSEVYYIEGSYVFETASGTQYLWNLIHKSFKTLNGSPDAIQTTATWNYFLNVLTQTDRKIALSRFNMLGMRLSDMLSLEIIPNESTRLSNGFCTLNIAKGDTYFSMNDANLNLLIGCYKVLSEKTPAAEITWIEVNGHRMTRKKCKQHILIEWLGNTYEVTQILQNLRLFKCPDDLPPFTAQSIDSDSNCHTIKWCPLK